MYPRTVALILLLPLAASVSGQAPPSGLTRLLESQLAGFPARTGLYVKHLGTGEEASVRGDESFSSASVIKLAILVRAFQLADEQSLDLNERVTIGRADLRDGSGVLQYHDLGLTPTYRDLLTEMVITSDNTATDLMVRKIGGVEALNAWLTASGFTHTRMVGRGHEYRKKLLTLINPEFANLTPEETTGLQYASQDSALFGLYTDLFTGARAKWVEMVRDPANRRTLAGYRSRLTVQDRAYWLGDMTPRETGRLLEAIERGTLTSKASAAAMKTILGRQQAGSRRIPHFLDVPVAHKTGDSGVIANDVALVSARSGTVIISFFVNGVTGSYGEAEDRMGHAAREIVRYFDGVASPRPAAPPVPAGQQTRSPAPARRVIQPAGYKPTPSPLVPAILVGDTLYLSGSTGGDPVSGQLVPGGLEPELKQIMTNVQTVLAAADMSLGDVVAVTTYLADMSDFARYNDLYKSYFPNGAYPTRSTVAVSALARGARLEITMTAVRSK